ncbi:hypothetical protein PR048_022201 [Dryococelus australis]|uniref:Uncharacterized protein n=1 Tax=Dryococelus australis TaxID=614101 RepID=A0ABQ9H0K9_9NEOP|nr:hypothetical protein PR048_022201 [Dryococelus australis]
MSYDRYVMKLECTNRMARNYNAKLNRIIKETSHIRYRKESTRVFPRLTNGARAAIKEASENRYNTEKKDIIKVPLMSSTSTWPAIIMALDQMISKADCCSQLV